MITSFLVFVVGCVGPVEKQRVRALDLLPAGPCAPEIADTRPKRARSALRRALASLLGPAWPGPGGFAAVGEQGGDGLLPGYCFTLDFRAGSVCSTAEVRIVLRASD